MSTIYTVKMTAHYTNDGYITLSKTVLKAIAAIATTGRTTMSAQDVTYVINNNVYSDEQVEEKRVAALLKKFASDYAKGYRYNALRGKLSSIDGYFFQYR